MVKEGPAVLRYSGDYPTLCMGTLYIWYNDKLYSLKNVLYPGGMVNIETIDVTHGPWGMSKEELPSELKPWYHDILGWVNKNVGWSCCGGCL